MFPIDPARPARRRPRRSRSGTPPSRGPAGRAAVHELRHVPAAAPPVLLQLPAPRLRVGRAARHRHRSTASRSCATRCTPIWPTPCPYVSGVVELDGTQGAGARMLVNIIDCDAETVTIGDRVEIVFEHVNDEMTHTSVPSRSPEAEREENMTKIWANSGDSHLVEPDDLFTSSLPPALADAHAAQRQGRRRRMGDDPRRRPGVPPAACPRPRLTDENGLTVDRASAGRQRHDAAPGRPRPGGHLGRARVPVDRDLDVVDPGPRRCWPPAAARSTTGRSSTSGSPALRRAPRRSRCSTSSSAVAEIKRAAEPRLQGGVLLRRARLGVERLERRRRWEPVWAALEETGLVLGFHIGTEPHDASTIARRRTSAGPAARCSTTWRPPTAASGPSPR